MNGTSVRLMESKLEKYNIIWTNLLRKLLTFSSFHASLVTESNGVHFKPLTREVGMENHPKSAFAHRQPALLAFLCLLLLLPYLLLPAVYYGHLTVAFLPASQEDPIAIAGPLAIGTSTEKPPRPYHNSNACPICRAASSLQDFGFFSLPQPPECANQVWITAFNSPTPAIANSDLLVSGPRAPPVSL
jgi:hypothetical protein